METAKRKNKKYLRVQEKIKKTAKKIQNERSNNKKSTIVNATDLEEIHRLLNSTDDNLNSASSAQQVDEPIHYQTFKFCGIPSEPPLPKVFEEKYFFSLFTEKNCFFKNFINPEEGNAVIFGEKASELSEDSFRQFLGLRVFEILKSEQKCASIGLYVLHLMSVHPDHNLVSACFDFLIQNPFVLQPEDLFPIFTNFGVDNLFPFDQKKFSTKFSKSNEEVNAESKSFSYNVEMVGQTLLHYITKELIAVNPNIQHLITGLLRITLDPIIFYGSFLPLYSNIITILCIRVKNDFKLTEIASWLYLKEQHLLNQLEICRIVAKSIFPDLHEILVQKTISSIIGFGNSLFHLPIKIDYTKLVFKKLKDKELSALELYSVLQLVNSLLPGFTATVEDSIEIKKSLVSLKLKINKWKDPVDLVRLKLEIAKVENLVTDMISVAMVSTCPSAKRFKCSN